jgi:hypothetical protein
VRRNPMLMTVLGNPGRRYRANPFILIDSGNLKIIRSWKGSMMDRKPWLWAQEAARRLGRDVFVVAHTHVPHGFKAGVEVSKMFFAGGPWQVVGPDGGGRAGDWDDLPPHRNPSIGASIMGSMAGGLIANALSNPVRPKGYRPFNWDTLFGCVSRDVAKHYVTKFDRETLLQALAWNDHNSTWWPDELATREHGSPTPWRDAVRGMLDIWEDHRPGSNPPRTRKGAEDAIDKAIGRAWAQLMSGVQVPIMDIPRIFRDIKLEMAGGVDLQTAVQAVGGRYRVNRNPGGHLRPKRSGIYCTMCGEWDPRKGPYRRPKVGPSKGKVICDLCYRGWRSGRRGGAAWAKNGGARGNPGRAMPTKKVTMSIQKFAKIIRSRRDPKLWNDFVKKAKGYHAWSHGTWPTKVTVEVIKKPGVSGIWMTYDMGKEPEKTYIMPKGSKRKGAWKHPWGKMPSLKGDPEAGIILTKLAKGNRLTDFLHG